MSLISKRGYLTVNRRTGIMIDLGVAVFIQTVWFVLLSLRVALVIDASASSDTSSPISADSRAVV